MMRPAQRLRTSIDAVIGRCQGVMSSGVWPGASVRASAIELVRRYQVYPDLDFVGHNTPPLIKSVLSSFCT